MCISQHVWSSYDWQFDAVYNRSDVFGANLSTFGHVNVTCTVVIVDTLYFDGVSHIM